MGASPIGSDTRTFLLAAAPDNPKFDAGVVMSTRIHRGLELYECLDPERNAQMDELSLFFADWEHAYEAVRQVWGLMKTDPGFDVDVLVAKIKYCFAEFLVRGVRVFMKDEGNDL
jgi:hypothetical protein